ncbi:MAG TPA: sigma 54-interacting transcriptional regulator [Terriglobia bacterium]|nr:sigma 54-interacting transcriptional regulator [Terriglobia bacterium]
MADETESQTGAPTARQTSAHQVLLEVSESIGLHRELPALFHAVAECLPRIVRFDSLWLVLHDPERHTMRLHIHETRTRVEFNVVERSIEDSPSGMVWQTQQPLVVPDLEHETRFPEAIALLRGANIRSLCILPLTTAHRRLGAVGFGSQQLNAYGRDDVQFLHQVAGQVALAMDNTLSHQEALSLQRLLEHQRDRLRLLLDLNNVVVPNLDLRQLLRAISTSVREVMKCDFASVTLPEPGDSERLRVYARNFARGDGSEEEELVIATAGSAAGEVLRTGKPLAVTSQELPRFSFHFNPALAAIKAACFLPLISQHRTLGTLNLGRLDEAAFTAEDLEFLRQVANQVAIAVENALDYGQMAESRERLTEEKIYLTEEILTEHNFEEIIGESPALKRVLQQVEIVAPTDSTVLILGETGTGKELIARAIHNLSSRRDRTFVKVNCAAIPLGLLESELFGHEKGAFTGAISQKIGRFELAHLGTLFLDEVGDIPLELQPKLLRVLQEQEFERLGSTRTIHVNARLLAATSRDLLQMVEDREFREDLYYRLNIFPVVAPPLRERPQDVPLLVDYFVDKFARQMNKRIDTIPAEIMEALKRYHWPGNVRELQNFIERAVILTRAKTLRPPLAELKLDARNGPSQVRTLAESERTQILQALREANGLLGGPGGVAERLGLKRTTLFYKMRRLGITRPAK